MDDKENPVELLIMCVVMIVLSLAGVASAFSRDLFRSLDGLLILFISLLVLLIFSLLLVAELKQQGWFDKHHKDDGAGSGTVAPAA